MMKLLLTSAGIRNASIRDALLGLLGKPIADSNALAIDDETAIQVLDGSVNVISEGHWKYFARPA